MKTIRIFSWVILLCSSSVLALAQTERTEEKPTRMSYADFRLDHDKLQDRLVELKGYLITVGDTFILYDRKGSANGFFADSSALSDDERRTMMSRCGSGCQAVVVGRAAEVLMNPGIVLVKLIEPKPQIAKAGKTDASQGPLLSVPDYLTDYEKLFDKQVQLRAGSCLRWATW